MKKNNRGQIFVSFVIILPLLLFLIIVFINKSFVYYEKTKLDNLLNLACESKDINKIINKNDSNVNFIIKNENGKIMIDAVKEINNKKIRIKKVCEE